MISEVLTAMRTSTVVYLVKLWQFVEGCLIFRGTFLLLFRVSSDPEDGEKLFLRKDGDHQQVKTTPDPKRP